MNIERHPGFCRRCVWRNGHNPERCFGCTKRGVRDGTPSGFDHDVRVQEPSADSASKWMICRGFCDRCFRRGTNACVFCVPDLTGKPTAPDAPKADAPKQIDKAPEKHPGFCWRCLDVKMRVKCWCCILMNNGQPNAFCESLPSVDRGQQPQAAFRADLGATLSRVREEIRNALEGELGEIAELVLQKNAAYGDSALNPLRVFSSASPEEQIYVRLDDKLSRVARGHSAGEDVVADMIGYLLLLRVARQRDAQ